MGVFDQKPTCIHAYHLGICNACFLELNKLKNKFKEELYKKGKTYEGEFERVDEVKLLESKINE